MWVVVSPKFPGFFAIDAVADETSSFTADVNEAHLFPTRDEAEVWIRAQRDADILTPQELP